VTGEPSLAFTLTLGFLLGVRHAMDADHLAAVSTFVSQDRGLLRACLLGTFWGAGHTVSLLVAGTVVVAFRLVIPPQVERAFELVVALVLVLLGGSVLLRSFAALALHRHEHVHDGVAHTHVHSHADDHGHDHRHLLRVGRRPFLIGLLHGMAGSAALTVLAVTTIPSALGVVGYILVFGLGSTGGMLLSSGVMAIPFVLSARRSALAHGLIQAAVGAGSLVLGLWLVWRHATA
jgi:high-affinity nickel permease